MKTTKKITDSERDFFVSFYREKIKGKKKMTGIITGSRMLNILEAFGFEIDRGRTGSWNGYGYERLCNAYIPNKKDQKKWAEFAKFLEKSETKKEKKIVSEEEKNDRWAMRLAKLAGITLEDAIKIAEEKLEYRDDQVQELEDRQLDRYSRRREVLINSIRRSNPLRRIEDEAHALAIIRASERHNNTNYEALLEEGREKALCGEVDRSEVREYARSNFY